MTRHTTAPVQSLRLRTTNEPLSQLVSQWRRGSMDPNPPYQRRPVWTLGQQIALIRSLLDGTPIPAIITNRRTDTMAGTRYVIDGKQRITAMRAFMDDAFMVPATWFAPKDVLASKELTGAAAYMYGDSGLYVSHSYLSDYVQAILEEAPVPVAEGRFRTVQEEAAVYLRVNGGGVDQTPEDMARAARVAEGE